MVGIYVTTFEFVGLEFFIPCVFLDAVNLFTLQSSF